MPLAHSRVLVFGPTGNVGSIVARTAQRHGAKVFLAMRDTSKPVPDLQQGEESRNGFERIHADLTQPTSIRSAAKQADATSAFIYLAHRSSDHMRGAIEAMKEAGISFVVFLSSFTIRGEIDKVPPTSRIPYIHARVEMNLEAIYGHENYVALRAGAFATNTLWWREGINAGEVKLDSPKTEYDYITPTDMGRVGGTVLVNGQSSQQHIIYLYGPRLITRKDAIERVLHVLGKEPRFLLEGSSWDYASDADPTTSGRVTVKLGAEEPKSDWFVHAYANHQEGVDNILRFSGKPAQNLEEWIEGNAIRYSLL